MRRLGIAAALAALALAGLPALASAGQWVQVSCVNLDGSAASSEGWTASTSSSTNESAAATCGPGTPMNESLGGSSAGGSSADLHYSPPSGSTLAGGTLVVSGYANGSGPNTSMVTAVYAPQPVYPDDAVFECIGGMGSNPCAQTGYSFADSTVTLPANVGGTVDLAVDCSGGSGYSCNGTTNAAGDSGEMELNSAQLLLANASVPTASDFSGTILAADASGSANLLFTASESSGPGIYTVTVDIDGNSVYSATPDTDGGACVAKGTYSGTSALEFDAAQPCPLQDSVDVPIDTTSLTDGQHDLTVHVTDAAGNTATVYDGYITTANATAEVSTPAPSTTPTTTTKKKTVTGLPKVSVTFVARAHYSGAVTRFLKLTSSKFNPRATLTLTDSGPRHPKLKPSREPAERVGTLLKELTKLSFHSGDHLILTVTVPHRRRERLEFTFRQGKVPTATLL